MTLPSVEVFAQFSNAVAGDFIFNDPATGNFDDGLFSGGANTDISDYLTGGITVRRGRTDFLSDFSAGTCSLTLDDPDRRFDASNSAGPYFGDLAPGRLFTVSVYGVTIFSGSSTGFESVDEFSHGTTQVAVQLEDILASLARRPMTAWTSTSELPGARIAAVLNRGEVDVPEAQRALDAGASTLQADPISAGSSTLNYLQLVARSDLGRLFASKENVLTFIDRYSSALASVSLSITDDPSGGLQVEPVRIRRRNTIRDTYNRVTVDREGGTAQTSTLDAATIDEQGGIRTLQRPGLLLNSDGDSLSMADWLLFTTSTAENRIVEIDLNVTSFPLETAIQIASLELGDRIDVSYTPNQVGSVVEAVVLVESIEHSVTAFSHRVKLGVSAVTNTTPFIFDDVTYGNFDGPGLFIF
jgi:hypothetical protein